MPDKVSPIHDFGGQGAASHAIQDYLKAIFKLEHGGQVATTSAIADKLAISPASVSGMLKKLDRSGFATYNPYQGAHLTEAGRRVALELIRHHRLIELYLQKALGYTWDKVDAEAERLEHVISEEMEEAMARFLNQPTHDPHGDPIPTRDGYMPSTLYEPLSAMQPGQVVYIRRVKDSDPELLRYLGRLGMYPGARIEVVAQAPFDGPLLVRIEGLDHALGAQVTASVFVEPEAAA